MIEVYTDGSSRKKDQWIGAYSFYIERNGKPLHEETHTKIPATNNVAELLAVIHALHYCGQHYPNEPITINTDSQYVINGTKSVLKTNVEYWNLYRQLAGLLQITVQKVPAHKNNKGNNHVDKLARAELRRNFDQ